MRPEDDVAVAHGVLEVEPLWPQDEVVVAAHGVVEPRDRVTGHTVRVSVTDQQVERRCTE
jgi:hypothetical protein